MDAAKSKNIRFIFKNPRHMYMVERVTGGDFLEKNHKEIVVRYPVCGAFVVDVVSCSGGT